MKTVLWCWVCALVGFGCSTGQNSLVLAPVGPVPTIEQKPVLDGTLVVYSALDVHANVTGGFPEHRHFTDYKLLTADGQALQSIHNDGVTPSAVSLPPGKYQVVARANHYGTVTVPVVIVPHEQTIVHLDGGSLPMAATSSDANVVRLPNGSVVGWRNAGERLVGTDAPMATSK